ncbi:hypothetical protein EYF80_053125 [Liparis tanakae]|uniref:Uncharacterized protein n=1 Tax=Liparis tanakae TaxID=230148 RepID=A0A4Z2F8T0_9TELE|nr:hypothetical protein EYF80_053125 [Liparis tanakae]
MLSPWKDGPHQHLTNTLQILNYTGGQRRHPPPQPPTAQYHDSPTRGQRSGLRPPRVVWTGQSVITSNMAAAATGHSIKPTVAERCCSFHIHSVELSSRSRLLALQDSDSQLHLSCDP